MRGDGDRTLACCQRAVALSPTFAPALYNLGKELLDRDLDSAVEYLGQAARALPTGADTEVDESFRAEVYRSYGSALLRRGRSDDIDLAIKQFSALAELPKSATMSEQNTPAPLRSLAQALLQRNRDGDRAQADLLVGRAVSELEIGKLHLSSVKAKNLDKAIIHLSNAIEGADGLQSGSADYFQALYSRAKAYEGRDTGTDRRSAIKDFEVLLVGVSKNSTVRRLLAVSLARDKQIDRAIEECRIALTIKPDDAAAYLMLSNLFIDRNRVGDLALAASHRKLALDYWGTLDGDDDSYMAALLDTAEMIRVGKLSEAAGDRVDCLRRAARIIESRTVPGILSSVVNLSFAAALRDTKISDNVVEASLLEGRTVGAMVACLSKMQLFIVMAKSE
jgi:tetratricopeptide (TPR) repeat protein